MSCGEDPQMGHAELFPGMSTSGKEIPNLEGKHGLSFQSINSIGRSRETLFFKIMLLNVSLGHTY